MSRSRNAVRRWSLLLLALFVLLPCVSARANDGWIEPPPASVLFHSHGKRVVADLQHGWTVVLSETTGGPPLWRWTQDGLARLIAVLPYDDGSAVGVDDWQQLHYFDKRGTHRRVLEDTTDWSGVSGARAYERFERAPCGQGWGHFAILGTFRHSGAAYFFRRSYWGESQLIEMTTGRLILGGPLCAHLELHLVAHVRNWLRSPSPDQGGLCSKCSHHCLGSETRAYAFVIKRYWIGEGLGLLDEILQNQEVTFETDFPRCLERTGGYPGTRRLKHWVLGILVVGLALTIRARHRSGSRQQPTKTSTQEIPNET